LFQNTIIVYITAASFLVAQAMLPANARGHSGSSSHGSSHSNSTGGGKANARASGTSDHVVRGYVRKNGTYVAPYHATNRNGTKNDNYSTKGNVNPYTGKTGTKHGDY
jgi:hypothetical protein